MPNAEEYIKNTRVAAGLLMYSLCSGEPRVLLVHPGGPYHAKKDLGAWSIPKGVPDPCEELLDTARREFEEETGLRPDPGAEYFSIGSIKQKGGKTVHAWAFEGEWEDGREVVSNRIIIEWPPKTGKALEIPEVDRAEMFAIAEAKEKIKDRQVPLLERLAEYLEKRQ